MKTTSSHPSHKKIQGAKRQIKDRWSDRDREVRHRLARMRQRKLLNAIFDVTECDTVFDS